MVDINWGEVIVGGLDAATKYLVSRDQEKTARAVAKASGGQGMGFDTMMALITMGASMGGGRAPSTSTAPNYVYGSGVTPPSGFQVTPGAPGWYSPIPQTPIPGPMPFQPSPPQLPAYAGGGPIVPAIYQPPYVQQAGLSGLVNPAIDYLQGQGGFVSGGGGGIISAPQVFNQAQTGVRAKRFFAVPNPVTGNLSWFRNVGRPILFSGDLTACKRVNKVAARARRASPRKRAAARRRR